MITKNELWKKIRLELKQLARSQQITVSVMERIRNLEDENQPISPDKNYQRRD